MWTRIALLATLGFALLALSLVAVPGVIEAVDAFANRVVAPFRTDAGISFFLVVTALGGGTGIILAAVAFTYFSQLSTTNVLRLVVLLGLVLVANKLLKEFFARARPEALQWFDALPSYSFPSAHATSAMALYGFIAVVLYRRTGKLAYAAVPMLVAVLVGVSRIVLGAHHFTDVVAGFLLGLMLLAATLALPLTRLSKKYA